MVAGKSDTSAEEEWTAITINLIDSCYSNKKTLVVNGKKILDNFKTTELGKKPFTIYVD